MLETLWYFSSTYINAMIQSWSMTVNTFLSGQVDKEYK